MTNKQSHDDGTLSETEYGGKRVAVCPDWAVRQRDAVVNPLMRSHQASSMRMSVLSGRSSNAARSEVISPILVRVGTEEVGA